MRVLLLAPITALAATGALAQTATEVWRTPGFASPESAYYDAGSDRIVVSNIGTFGPEAGMDGRLSLLTPDGAVEAADWVTGLMDPKGMASAAGTLYVADAMGLHVIDMATATVTRTVALDGALFPNDVTIGADGTIYVTAMFGSAIWAVRDGLASFAVPPGGVPLPNGILAVGDALIVGSFGDEMNADFTVKNPGGLLSVDPATGAVTPLAGAQGTGSIDGLAQVGDWIIYDDNPAGALMGWKDGVNTVIANVGPGAADLGAMGDMVLIPNLGTGEVVAYRIE